MKDKPSEWVSIADLMAGVVAVVMLLLVVSVLQKKVAAESGVAAQKKIVNKVLNDLRAGLAKQGAEDLLRINISAQTVVLPDNVFNRGSACMTQKAKDAVALMQKQLGVVLGAAQNGQVLVEGHTDNIPVGRPVIDYARNCTVYDDNYTLSAARARQVREVLIGNLTSTEAKRVIVAGYGDSHPLEKVAPSDASNRRVEIHFVLQESVKP
jgi:chemotaxis protein MotB